MGDSIDDLIEEIIVDAYGEHEQLWSFRQVFEDDARFPFRGRVVGVDVDVTSVDFDGDERRGLVAVCRRAGEVHEVSLLEVAPVGPLRLPTRQLVDAYRRWAGAALLIPITPDHAMPWVYPRFAPVPADVAPVLRCSRRATGIPPTSTGARPANRWTHCARRSLPPGCGPASRWNR